MPACHVLLGVLCSTADRASSARLGDAWGWLAMNSDVIDLQERQLRTMALLVS